jgi:hypothetical protein
MIAGAIDCRVPLFQGARLLSRHAGQVAIDDGEESRQSEPF